MQTATKGNTTWTYTYNADGLRTGKTNGSTTYSYKWNENGQLSSMVCGTSSAWFYYDTKANRCTWSMQTGTTSAAESIATF